MNVLNNFLKNNPAVLTKYVALGTAVVDATLAPLSRLMRHLLLIQGADPNAQPGEKYRKALAKAVDAVEDKKDFDTDYDFSWIKKSLDTARENLKNLKISKDTYRRLTDLSNLADRTINLEEEQYFKSATEVNKIATPAVKKETDIASTKKSKSKPVIKKAPKKVTRSAVKPNRSGVFRRVS
jgi:hypothetical protein